MLLLFALFDIIQCEGLKLLVAKSISTLSRFSISTVLRKTVHVLWYLYVDFTPLNIVTASQIQMDLNS